MATFRVGQRVKKVRSRKVDGTDGIPVGSECMVVSVMFIAKGQIGCDGVPYKYDSDITVRFGGSDWGSRSDLFEPIQYDGNQAITWDACCWRPPEKVTESV